MKPSLLKGMDSRKYVFVKLLQELKPCSIFQQYVKICIVVAYHRKRQIFLVNTVYVIKYCIMEYVG